MCWKPLAASLSPHPLFFRLPLRYEPLCTPLFAQIMMTLLSLRSCEALFSSPPPLSPPFQLEMSGQTGNYRSQITPSSSLSCGSARPRHGEEPKVISPPGRSQGRAPAIKGLTSFVRLDVLSDKRSIGSALPGSSQLSAVLRPEKASKGFKLVGQCVVLDSASVSPVLLCNTQRA